MDGADDASEDVASSIIGRFGVGFYSAFMVADELTVYTRSATEGDVGWCWKSDGTGSYTIAEAEGVAVGTKVVIHLKDKEKGNFGNKYNLERLIKKYSNFVGFPIAIDGDRANKIEALWAQPPSQVTQEQHNEFYRFIANAFDTPRYHFQFAADAPLAIQCLLYVPQMSAEKLGMGRADGGVSVYSRKVMIKDKVEDILPDWLRFMKGVIDSEDIPLNISRENLQDSSLIERVGAVVTRWVLGQLAREAKRDPVKYNEFYNEFGAYIKEGACTDRTNMEAISKLLRFESSKPPPPLPVKDDEDDAEKDKDAPEIKTVSLAQVNERVVEGQKNIFYLATPSRELATSSPYFEAFDAADVEVLYVFNDMDEFVCQNIGSFDGKPLLNVETQEASAALKALKSSKEDEDDKEELDPNALLETEVETVTTWMKEVLSGKASSVKAAEAGRMKNSPAMITGHSPSSALRWQKMLDPGADQTLPPQMLEINTAHPIIKGLHDKHSTDPELAELLAEQLYDNSLVAAGLLEDSRSMLPRVNTLMERLAKSE
jgi:TNF receptor-associated protein 1